MSKSSNLRSLQNPLRYLALVVLPKPQRSRAKQSQAKQSQAMPSKAEESKAKQSKPSSQVK